MDSSNLPTSTVPDLNNTSSQIPTNDSVTTNNQPVESMVIISPEPIDTQTTTANKPPEVPKGKSKKLFLGIVIAFLLLAIIVSGGIYALAYNKITLSQFPEFQKRVEFLVMDLPFTPKSARYLIHKASLVNKSYTSHSFDMSMALTPSGSGISNLLGLSNFDFLAKGQIDYSDLENITLSMNISATKELNIDFAFKNKILYFKINKFPLAILALTGLDSESVSRLTNVWISYDTTPLTTNARELLNNSKSGNEQFQLSDRLMKTINETIAKEVSVTKELDNGIKVYKLKLNPTDETLDKLITEIEKEFEIQSSQVGKPSDTIKNASVEIWLDAKDFYTRQISTVFTIKPNKNPYQQPDISETPSIGYENLIGENAETKVAIVIKLSDFGKPVQIDIPENAITFEEYLNTWSSIVIERYKDSASIPNLDKENQTHFQRSLE
ncbi:MAG: hypothetical protein NZM26_03955 [Patescibacteria group bacterium]|nr:hypothetical protein [Patescibacteria group bacterium]